MNWQADLRLLERMNAPIMLSTQSATFLPVQEKLSLYSALWLKAGWKCFCSGSLVRIALWNRIAIPILNKWMLLIRQFFISSTSFSPAFLFY